MRLKWLANVLCFCVQFEVFTASVFASRLSDLLDAFDELNQESQVGDGSYAEIKECCEENPKSINGFDIYGCAGALWSGGDLSREYCRGQHCSGKTCAWYRKCCHVVSSWSNQAACDPNYMIQAACAYHKGRWRQSAGPIERKMVDQRFAGKHQQGIKTTKFTKVWANNIKKKRKKFAQKNMGIIDLLIV